MKKSLSLVIGLMMVLTLLPVGAAADGDYVKLIGRTLLSGQYLATVDADPADIVGTTPDSYVAMYRDGVLTLNGFVKMDYTGTCGILSENDLTVVLQGNNVIGSAALHPSDAAVRSEGKLTVQGSDGSLTAYGQSTALNGRGEIDIQSGTLTLFAEIPLSTWDDVDRTATRLTISGGTINATGSNQGIFCGVLAVSGGTISVTGDIDRGIYCGTMTVSGGTIHATGNGSYGINVAGALTITGGNVTANGSPDAIYVRSGAITIEGGTVNATCAGHGIYAESGEITLSGGSVTAEGDNYGLYAYSGAITISGGTVDASSGLSFGIYSYDTLTISGGDVTATSDQYYGIYAYNDLIVTGGTVDATGEVTGILAEDIELGSRVTVRTGGTVRKALFYTVVEDGFSYIKTETEGGLTKYYKNNSEVSEDICPDFPDTEDAHLSTFASGDDVYYNAWGFAFVNASPEVVLGTRSTSSRDDDDDDDDEPVITGKITSYEELSRLSKDYKAMKEYADTLGLGDAPVIGTWDIETRGSAPWKIIFHLDAKYLGDTLTIIHEKDDGTFEFFTAVVDKSGEAAITVTSASPFLVVRGKTAGNATTSTASAAEENPNTGFDFGWWF
ncbi:MAG TPA: hypothetical protein PKY19_03190 [Oscillospiraceae bacterium]|nr:hypothetical protein [Oscillospiraceae bacterium]HXK77472.1 hypothetical protein [Oscillospiraceae bacterium]